MYRNQMNRQLSQNNAALNVNSVGASTAAYPPLEMSGTVAPAQLALDEPKKVPLLWAITFESTLPMQWISQSLDAEFRSTTAGR